MASKRVNYFLPIVIGIVISLIFCGVLILTLNKANNDKIEKFYLNELIKSNINKNNKKTYLSIKSISPKIATYGKNNGYYIVSDGEYNYVVLLSNKKAKEIMNIDLYNNPVTINGISKEMNKELKEIVLEKYNSSKDENEKISIKEYYSYFGDVYLDETLALK
ncbi:MAG: hypothetical protein J6O56_03175 [Bacilli bacterium]|nr:hypothetical protein [Bacilli bacterium]